MTREARRIWLLGNSVAAVLWTAPLTSLAAQGTGIVTGRVLDVRDNRPIADAQVFTENRANGARTDRDGRFRITNVAPGPHTIGVRMIGFAAKSTAVTVAAGQTATVDM